MKVKAVDIAKELGISKSTVSLALNGKPGVSDITREKIFEIKNRMEQETAAAAPSAPTDMPRIIKLVTFISGTHIAKNSEMDLWTPSFIQVERAVKAMGYSLGVSYFDLQSDNPDDFIRECSNPAVAGILLIGTELDQAHESILHNIKKPAVLLDYDPTSESFTCVLNDNQRASEKLVGYLVSRNIHDIYYLSMSQDIYNFRERRKGFTEGLQKYGITPVTDRIIPMGNTIREATESLRSYLDSHEIPEAFITESYHLTMACIQVFKDRNIKYPDDISLIGIDDLPDYAMTETPVSVLSIPYNKRSQLAINMLHEEITNPSDIKFRIYLGYHFIERGSCLPHQMS